jgi:molecular chaperone GrpE (heat shock protein)
MVALASIASNAKNLNGNQINEHIIPHLSKHLKDKIPNFKVIHQVGIRDFDRMKQMYGEEKIWIRPKRMFFEKVKVDNGEVPRFQLIEKDESDWENKYKRALADYHNLLKQTAKEKAEELGKLEGLTDEEKEKSYEIVGLGALKYFMLKVDPKKKMLFNPAESIDFNGNTGPFIQYTYARIQSLLNRANFVEGDFGNYQPNASEKELIMQLSNFKEVVEKAAETLSPAQVANYVYDLVKTYNSFYQNNPVMTLEDENAKQFKLQISDLTAKTIKKSLHLLGINVVNRM